MTSFKPGDLIRYQDDQNLANTLTGVVAEAYKDIVVVGPPEMREHVVPCQKPELVAAIADMTIGALTRAALMDDIEHAKEMP